MNERVIFDAAAEISNMDRRREFLEQSCGGDIVLRTRIEALLQSHESSSQFLNVPVVEQIRFDVEPTGSPTVMQPNPVAAEQVLRHEDNSDDEMTIQLDLSFLMPPSKPDSFGRIGHYEIQQTIGHGAFGIVFKAFDEKLCRVVAIKVLNPQLATTSPPRKRFLREARSAAAIRHENVVRVYSVEEQPLPYLVMEYIHGQNLQQKLDATGPLEVPEILEIGRQLAAGLAAAHAEGLIHRDIKPGNILLENGVKQRVKITDFGLARAVDDASLSRNGLISGTPMYMAPEQAKGADLDHRTDLFSLGSVLYVMATGRSPFRAVDPYAVLKRVIDETPRPIQQIIPEVPDWLCAIITKLHAKQPDNRFQSAQEVADLLATCRGPRTFVNELTDECCQDPEESRPKSLQVLMRFNAINPWLRSRSLPLIILVILIATVSVVAVNSFGLIENRGDKEIVPIDGEIAKTMQLATLLIELGGIVTLDGGIDIDAYSIETLGMDPPIVAVDLRNSVSKPEFPDVVKLLQDCRITRVKADGSSLQDQQLKLLSSCEALQFLYIGGTNVTPRGIESAVATLPNLVEFGIQNLDLDSDAIRAIGRLGNLQQLNMQDCRGVSEITLRGLSEPEVSPVNTIRLAHTRLNDACIASLETLPNLSLVDVTGTDLTDQGTARLRRKGTHVVRN